MKALLISVGAFISSILSFLYLKVTLPFFTMLDTADKWLMQALNFDGGTAVDSFFYCISSKAAWIPIAAVFICVMLANRKRRREAVFIIIGIALAITLCDQISSSIIKPVIGRLRPSHCDAISDTLHYVNNYRSGRFGFCSSHAANAMGVFVFLSHIFRNRKFVVPFLVWTVLVCYSRIYLGVHYPGDVICGCFIGAVVGMFVFKLYTFLMKKLEAGSSAMPALSAREGE